MSKRIQRFPPSPSTLSLTLSPMADPDLLQKLISGYAAVASSAYAGAKRPSSSAATTSDPHRKKPRVQQDGAARYYVPGSQSPSNAPPSAALDSSIGPVEDIGVAIGAVAAVQTTLAQKGQGAKQPNYNLSRRAPGKSATAQEPLLDIPPAIEALFPGVPRLQLESRLAKPLILDLNRRQSTAATRTSARVTAQLRQYRRNGLSGTRATVPTTACNTDAAPASVATGASALPTTTSTAKRRRPGNGLTLADCVHLYSLWCNYVVSAVAHAALGSLMQGVSVSARAPGDIVGIPAKAGAASAAAVLAASAPETPAAKGKASMKKTTRAERREASALADGSLLSLLEQHATGTEGAAAGLSKRELKRRAKAARAASAAASALASAVGHASDCVSAADGDDAVALASGKADQDPTARVKEGIVDDTPSYAPAESTDILPSMSHAHVSATGLAEPTLPVRQNRVQPPSVRATELCRVLSRSFMASLDWTFSFLQVTRCVDATMVGLAGYVVKDGPGAFSLLTVSNGTTQLEFKSVNKAGSWFICLWPVVRDTSPLGLLPSQSGGDGAASKLAEPPVVVVEICGDALRRVSGRKAVHTHTVGALPGLAPP